MSLLDVRTRFVQVSGHYDLVVDSVDYADNGADFYINSAVKMLDRLVDIPESRAKLYYPLAAGEYSLTFQHSCRLITDVWINDTEYRTQLEKIPLNTLKYYYDELASATTNNVPLYYALAELRALETTAQASLGTFINITHGEADTKYDYRGIVIVPPADTSYVVEVSGLFKQVVLSADADENYWTLEEDDLLLRTALYKLESFSRGTENAKNWLSAIKAEVMEIDKDIAQEESTGVNQLRG